MQGSQANENRQIGNDFESVFSARARSNGFTVIKNWYTCRFLPGGRPKVIKGELDFKLITQTGRIGYFDCKSFQNKYFTYSALDQAQIERAVLYNDTKVPSGFIVYFRASNKVVFFSGHQIIQVGPLGRFEDKQGIYLGQLQAFDVSRVIRPVRSRVRLRAV